jgi:hypothetical protein
MSYNELSEYQNLKPHYGELTKIELQKLSIFLSKTFKKNLYLQFKKEFSVDFLDWLYNKNPNGKAVTYNIFKGGEIIAHSSLIPTVIKYNNVNYKSALSVFTAVDEKYRGLYLFNEVTSKTLEFAKSNGTRFVLGTATDLNAELFVKCYKFKLISPLDIKVGFLKFEQENKISNNFNIFWNDETLSWRFNNPRFKYKISQDKKKFRIYNDNYKIFKIEMSSFSKINRENLFNNQPRIKYDINPFKVWIGLGSYSTNKGVCFDLPKFLRPSGLNLMIKDLSFHDTIIRKEEIKFNLFDFEVF